MIKQILFFILLFIAPTCYQAQNKIDIKNLRSDFARLNRQDKELETAKVNVANFLVSDSSETIREGLKAAQLYFVKNDLVKATIKNILDNASETPERLLLTTIEVSKTLYPGDFKSELDNLSLSTDSPVIFASALNSVDEKQKFIEYYKGKFSALDDDPLIKCLNYDFETDDSSKFAQRPSIEDLLEHEFQTDKTIIYTFFRSNRNYPGLSIIKKPDGSFVKNGNDEIFFIPQLGLSYADYPGYLTNGNTPEGIFSIVGSYISPTESIGPTRNVLTRIAYEVSPAIFFHGENKHSNWNIEDYESLLPDSWKEYFPIYEAYYAGQAGRKVIIMHGSTDDLRFFENSPYYPLTPTKGCISAVELWDRESGKCLKSDQVELINAFYSTGQIKGFLVVIELDDKNSPVTIDDIIPFL